MDKLFKFLGKNKKEVVKVEEKEQEKKPENLDVIGNIRWYGLPYVNRVLYWLTLAGANYGAREVVDHVMPGYEIRESQRVLKDYDNVLGPEEYEKFSKLIDVGNFYSINKKECQENIAKIAEDFPITCSELLAIDDALIQANIDTLANDPEYQKILADIKDSEKEGFDAGFDIVPVRNISALKNRVYVENMKTILSLGIENTGYSPRQMGTNLYNQLQYLQAQGENIRLDGSVLDYAGQNISLDSLPNIKGHLDNAYIDRSFMYELSFKGGRSLFAKWNKFLEDPQNKAIFSILQHEGYSISSFSTIPYQINSMDSFFRNEGNIEFFLRLADNVKSKDLSSRNVASVINFAREYYTHGQYDSLGSMAQDITKANEGYGKISLDDLNSKLYKFGIYENIYLPLLSETPEVLRLESGFFQDPALNIVRHLGYHKHPPKMLAAMGRREQASWIMQTCRLMATTGSAQTEESFNSALQSIMETRSNPEILNKEVFKDRNVVLMAHNEEWSAESQEKGARFGKDALIEGIKKQNPKTLEFFKAAQDLHDLVEKKQKTLQFIEKSEKLTLYIDAHGSEQGVSFSAGLPQNGVVTGQNGSNSIYYTEISDALIKRFQSGIKDTAIILDDACMSFGFIQNVYGHIRNYNENHNDSVPLPIAVGMSEVGQYGFSDPGNPYGSVFTKDLLSNSQDKTITMKNILDIERTNTGMASNISVFVPHVIEKDKWVFIETDDRSVGEGTTLRRKSPKNATELKDTPTIRHLPSGSIMEKKKMKVEVPFQIAENEKNMAEEQDIPTA